MAKDDEKQERKREFEEKKEKLQELIQNQLDKKTENENKVSAQRKELELLNNTRNNLFSSISNDERMFSEKDDEKNKLIMQKALRLTDLAEKERILHEKEF